MPWKRDRIEERGAQKNLGGGTGCVRFRSGVETMVMKRTRDGGYLYGAEKDGIPKLPKWKLGIYNPRLFKKERECMKR